MASNPNQPEHAFSEQVSKLANPSRLRAFEYGMVLVDEYSQRYGQHPDDTFSNISFMTIRYFAIYHKERSEFNQRFNYIWNDLKNPKKK